MTKRRHDDPAALRAEPFETLEQEGEYWDTHSVLAAIEKETPVGFHHAGKTATLTVRLQEEDIERIQQEADRRGVDSTTLARS